MAATPEYALARYKRLTETRFQKLDDGSLLDKVTGEIVAPLGGDPVVPVKKAEPIQAPEGFDQLRQEAMSSFAEAASVTVNIYSTGRATHTPEQDKHGFHVNEPDPNQVKHTPNIRNRRKGMSWAELIRQVGDEEATVNGEPVPLKLLVVRAAFYHAIAGNASMLKELFERSEGKMTQNLALTSATLNTDDMSDEDLNGTLVKLINTMVVEKKDAPSAKETVEADNEQENKEALG